MFVTELVTALQATVGFHSKNKDPFKHKLPFLESFL